MLPALVKLCCGISYPHLRSTTGLQRAAITVIGQELSVLQCWSQIQPPEWRSHEGPEAVLTSTEHNVVNPSHTSLKGEDLFYRCQGQEAMRKALELLESEEGWRPEAAVENGDVIYSKVIPGSRKVFRLEAELEASAEELYDILFVKVEEMHRWNPNIQGIKVLKRIGTETMVTHEVSGKTAGNLIGQRDFLSVRHSSKCKSHIYLGGAATQLESFPVQEGFLRAEEGPTCIVLEPLDQSRCRFVWLLNVDVKGWLPMTLVNQALPQAQLEFSRHLRRRLTSGVAPVLTASG